MATASFFGIAGKASNQMIPRLSQWQKRYSGQQVGNVGQMTKRLAPNSYKNVPSNENGSKSRMDFVLIISPFGEVK